tara:strand:- start:710 stop:931 length:222 start_codon:yes stop_codon:yes gene_type:complete
MCDERLFKGTIISGYGNNDGKTENYTLKELKDHNLDAYLGDDWLEDFKSLSINQEILVSGPSGVEQVKYKRLT